METVIIIKGNKGAELVNKIFSKTKDYIKTKEIMKKQYDIDIKLGLK